MDEWKENLTFQALSKKNDNVTMKFDYLAEVVFYFLKAFLTLESEFEDYENAQRSIVEETINAHSDERIITSTPDVKSIRKVFPPTIFDTSDSLSKIDSDFLKTSLTMSKTNLDASIEAAEEKNREIIRDIVDSTPGLFVDDKFKSDDLNKMKTEDESEFKLDRRSMDRLHEISEKINSNISYVEEMIKKFDMDFSNKESEDRKDFSVESEKENIEILKSDSQTKIKNVERKKVRRISPYNLRSSKKKFDFIDSVESLEKPIYKTVNENETNKIKAAEKFFDSVVKQLPEQRKKLKIDFDATNNIKISE